MKGKFIRPAEAFSDTPEGWKEYQDQWKLEMANQELGNNAEELKTYPDEEGKNGNDN